MSLPEEHRKALYEAYEPLSEEFFILFRCLRNAGFSHEDAMSLLCAIINRADNTFGNYRHSKISKREAMERFRKIMDERKEKNEEENIVP